MSCPHTETTAVLAAFGEAPCDFEEHLRECTDCRAVVQEHTATLAMLEPFVETRARAHQKTIWSIPAVAFLMAASLLMGLQIYQTSTPMVSTQSDTKSLPIRPEPTLNFFDDLIDQDLASLEFQVELFHLEES